MMPESTDARNRKFGKDVVSTVALTIATRAIGILAGILVARLLGPTGRGRYALLFVLATAVGAVATVGLEVWAARSVARSGVTDVVRSVLRTHMRRMSALLLLASVLIGVLGSRFEWLTLPELLFTVILTIGTLAALLAQAPLQGLGRMRSFMSISLAGGTVYLASAATLVVLDHNSVSSVLAGAALGSVSQILLALRTKELRSPRTARQRTSSYAAALRYGLPSSAGVALSFLSYRLDFILVAGVAGQRAAGLYAIAVAISELLLVLPNSMAQVLLPRVALAAKASDTERLVRVALIGMLTTGGLLALVCRELIHGIYGADFEASATAVPWLLLGGVALGVWKLLMVDLLARGYSRYRATTALTGLVVMVALDMMLIPAHGILGAAIGSAAGYTASLFHILPAWRKQANGRYHNLLGISFADIRSVRMLLRGQR